MRLSPLKIAIIYAFMGGLWILFSDNLLSIMVADTLTLTKLQTVKGWFYVFVTALMLYLLIQRYAREQKQAEEEIENYRKRLENIINSSNDIIFLKDKDFRYLVANKAHEKFFNVKVTDIIGKTDFDFMPKDVAEESRRSDEETLKYGSIKREEYSGCRYFHVIKHRVVDTSGDVCIVGVIRDITDYRHAIMKITHQQTKSEQTIDDITTIAQIQR